jgi:RecA/RadA recombinase
MPRKKKIAPSKLEDASSAQLDQLLQQFSDDHHNYKEDVYYKVSTGSLILDIRTGGIMPGLHRFCGVNEGGKTSEALEIIKNLLSSIDNSKGIYVKSEGRLDPEVQERTGITFVKNAEDWEVGTCFILECNVYETVFKIIRTLVKENPEAVRYGIVIDSVDSLIPKNDLEKDFDEACKVAGGALLASKIMQRISLDMSKGGHIMILISQVRADIQIDPYAKKAYKNTSASGGHALMHYSNFIFQFEGRYNKDLILEKPNERYDPIKNKIVGHEVKITIKKSPNEKTNTLITYPIMYGRKGGNSIWREREIRDLMFENGLLLKSGAWTSVDSSVIEEMKELGIEMPEKFQGRDSILKFMDDNPEFIDYWYKKIKEVYVES